jgi:methyltransferase (TIGR00027 family)
MNIVVTDSMATATSIIRDISDTSLWAAAFRARESERVDALFRDPLAARLAGTRGFEIAGALSSESHSTSWVTRTFLFDQFIEREIARGVDMVVNLGAGLDTRPYRMKLPVSLYWVEVDTPEVLAYKESALADKTPGCYLERIGLDLTNLEARRELLAKLTSRGKKILVLTEGVLIYFKPEEVATLARDLRARSQFESWILEVVSPPVLDIMRRTAGDSLNESGAFFQFGPVEGPSFFERHGWNLADVRGVLRTAVKLGRTPIDPRLLHLIPDSFTNQQNSGPWIGVCLFKSQQPDTLSPI